MTERWTIQQLSQVVERLLAAGEYEGQRSGRVRAVPDPRTIRYYTTLGLLDRPAEMRGRRAYYSRRHALQLAAIKRLQARGLSLVELQQSLTGADDRQLQRWAGLPPSAWSWPADASGEETGGGLPGTASNAPATIPATPRPARQTRDRFWTSEPEMSDDRADGQCSSTEAASSYMPRPAVHLTILPNVQVVIEGADWERLGEAQLRELRSAVTSFAATLGRLGLAAPPGKRAASESIASRHTREEE